MSDSSYLFGIVVFVMKQFIAHFTVALLTFAAGVTMTLPWLATRHAPPAPVVAQSEAEMSPLECAIRVAQSDSDDQSSTLAEIAIRLARLGQTEIAIELADSIEDEEERAVGIAKIATVLWKSGQRERALELTAPLRLFRHGGGRAVPSYSAYVAGRLAEELAASGQYDRVFEAVANETDDYLIRAGLDSIVDNYEMEPNSTKESEVLSKVLRLSRRITDGADGRVVLAVAVKYAAAGQLNHALRLAESLADKDGINFDRDDTLQEISLVLADAGQYDRAVQLAAKTDDYFRQETLIEIAHRLSDAGRSDRALSVLAGVTPGLLKEININVNEDELPGYKVERLAQLAVEYARAGRAERADALLGRALKAASGVWKNVEREDALHQVAVSYAQTGSYEEAVEVARSSDHSYYKIKSFGDIGVEMARAESDGWVALVVKDIQDISLGEREDLKADALLKIAGEYLAAERSDAALKILSLSFESAKVAKVNEFLPSTMQHIAVKYAEAGDYDRALEVVREIKSIYCKALALADIGVLQAQSGHPLSLYSKCLLNEIAGLPRN